MADRAEGVFVAGADAAGAGVSPFFCSVAAVDFAAGFGAVVADAGAVGGAASGFGCAGLVVDVASVGACVATAGWAGASVAADAADLASAVAADGAGCAGWNIGVSPGAVKRVLVIVQVTASGVAGT